MTANKHGRFLGVVLALSTLVAFGFGCGGGGGGGDPVTPVDPGTEPVEQGSDADPSTAEAVPGELLVGVTAEGLGAADLEATLAGLGTVLYRNDPKAYYRLLLAEGVTEVQARAALALPQVTYVESNYVVEQLAAPTNALWGSQNGAYSTAFRTQLLAAWDAWDVLAPASPNTPIVVAVLDTGVDTTHENLAGRLAAGHNFVLNTSNTTVDDDNGHGTAVASVLAGAWDTAGGAGVAGFAGKLDFTGTPAPMISVVPVKVLGANGKGNHADLAEGIDWASDPAGGNAKIVVVSLGSISSSYTLQKAVETAYTRGALVVAAAGNDSGSIYRYPAAYQAANQRVLSVGAVDNADAMVTNSNYGSWVNVAAPGQYLWAALYDPAAPSDTTYTSGQGTSFSGTSFSAAEVAGAAALVWTAYPALTNVQVRNLITSTADSYTRAAGKGIGTGMGRMNVQAALTRAAQPVATTAASLAFDALTVSGGGSFNATITMLNTSGTSTTYTLDQVLSSDGVTATTALKLPTSVIVAANAKTASFKISANGVSSSTGVLVKVHEVPTVTATVTVGPVAVSKVTFSPPSVLGGASATGTVTLDGPAPTGGIAVTLSCTNVTGTACAGLVLPGVTVAQGATTKSFTLPTVAVTAASTVRISGAVAGQGTPKPSSGFNLTIKPLLASVSFNTSAVTGGASVTGTVKLNGPAPTGGITVTLNETDAGNAATTPANVVVPAGQAQKTFTVSTVPVAAQATVSVTASYGGATTSAASFTVNPPSISTFRVSPATIIWWDATHSTSATGTITLNGNTAAATTVYITTSDAPMSVVSVPATVSINGTNTATFSIDPVAVTTASSVTVSVSLNANMSNAKTATVSVKPALAGMTVASGSVVGGNTVQGTVRLNAAAPAGGFSVDLASDSGRATVNATVVVGAGLTQATFTITGVAGATSATANVSASANGVTYSAVLKIIEPTISSFTLSSASIMAGATVTGSITLSAAAPAGYTVTLTSSNTAVVADNQLSVTFNAGDRTKTFTFVPHNIASSAAVIITAAANGLSKTANLGVLPTVSSVALDKSTITAGAGVDHTATLTIQLAGPAPTGGLTLAVASSDATKATVSAASVVVAAGASSDATITVTGVAAGTANITVTFDGQTKTVPVTVQ